MPPFRLFWIRNTEIIFRKLPRFGGIGEMKAMAEEKPYATREEVEHALTGLTKPQAVRLKRFAQYRMRTLGRAAEGRSGEDLLSEAFMATLLGASEGVQGRRWNKEVDIVKHLVEAMRSISSHWREASKGEEYLESELVSVDDGGQVHSPFENLQDGYPDALRQATAKEELARVLAMFKEDNDAIIVLEGWRDGWKREDFATVGMSPSDYDAAVKRIHYRFRNEK